MASLEEIIQERKKKIEGLRSLGINPYPEKTKRDHTIKEVLDNFDELSSKNTEVCIAGRIMSIRGHGALMFSHIMDESGRIQFLLKKDELGEEKMNLFKDYFDMGDFIEVIGTVFMTNTNEKTIQVKDFNILCKALRPIPTE
jgi:lysyl-tRNA synthetase class 2